MYPSLSLATFKGPLYVQRDRALSPADAQRVERTLAFARLILASCSLVAVHLDPLEPALYSGFAFRLLAFYTAYSIAVLLSVPLHARHPRLFTWTVHVLDFAWPALLTTFSSGSTSPLFLFFLFALMAAAYRWGFRATMLSGAVVVFLIVFQSEILKNMRDWRLTEGEFQINRFIIRAVYFLAIGFLLGYLAETEKRLRAQASAISRVVAKLGAERSVRANLESVFEELLEMFGCSRALFAARECKTDRLFLWSANQAEGRGKMLLHLAEAEPDQAASYFWVPQGHAWHASINGPASAPNHVLQLDANAARVHANWRFPPMFLNGRNVQSAAGVSFAIGEEWQAAFFLFDPNLGGSREAALRFLQLLLGRVSAAAFNVYLLRRLRSRAGILERARVARELHDGVIQSLIALEMQVDVLRRTQHSAFAEELAPLQQQLHNEILNVRELMHAMRPIELEPRQFLDFAADTVQRFQRETGIIARFVSEMDEVWLAPRTARELARILQEALVNVRKHACARTVIVRFAAGPGYWKLVIDDDGRGFDFSGRLDQKELDQIRRGPAIISERLRAIQGKLAIESRPGEGARLEITVPQKASQKAYG